MTQPFLPNEADAFNANQAEPDSVDFEILLLGYQGTGVESGCAVSESSPAAQTVDVASGVALLAGSRIVISAQADQAVSSANVTNPRIDLITLNSSGTVVVTPGTAAAQPVAPAIPASSIPLVFLYVPANDDEHADNQINDKRVLIGPADLDLNIRFVVPSALGGSDTDRDGLSWATAFATIQAALDSLPVNLSATGLREPGTIHLSRTKDGANEFHAVSAAIRTIAGDRFLGEGAGDEFGTQRGTLIRLTANSDTNVFEGWTARKQGGNVTGENVDDIIDFTAHPYFNNDPVQFTALTGGSSLATSTTYWVISRNVNDFQISATQGGGALDFGSDVTATSTMEMVTDEKFWHVGQISHLRIDYNGDNQTAGAGVRVEDSGDQKAGYGIFLAQMGESSIIEHVYVDNPGISEDTTVTGENVDDIIDATAHGLAVGQQVHFTAKVGGSALALNTIYWVINANVNDFQIAAYRDGTVLDFGSDITATSTLRAHYGAGIRITDVSAPLTMFENRVEDSNKRGEAAYVIDARAACSLYNLKADANSSVDGGPMVWINPEGTGAGFIKLDNLSMEQKFDPAVLMGTSDLGANHVPRLHILDAHGANGKGDFVVSYGATLNRHGRVKIEHARAFNFTNWYRNTNSGFIDPLRTSGNDKWVSGTRYYNDTTKVFNDIEPSVVEVSAAFTPTWIEGVINVDTAGGAVVITLPDNAAFNGKGFLIRRDGANIVTVNRAGSDTFDTGATSIVLGQDGDVLDIISIGDGEWKIV